MAIDGTCGSSPRSVLQRAVDLYQAEGRKGDSFDRVYCVFDKDSHDSYNETLEKISSKRLHDTYYAATSVPCFEYWLLLHFKYTTRPYAPTGTSSASEEVLRDVNEVMPEYAKGDKSVFTLLSQQLEFAKANALRALEEAKKSNTDNPSTHIHELVTYLQSIKSA